MASWLLLSTASLLVACGGGSDAPFLTSISVGPPDASLAKGLTTQYTATGIYSDGSRQDLGAGATWTSSAANIASIGGGATNAGLADAISPGATTITASMGSVSGSTTLHVTAATLVSIGVTPTATSVAAGLPHQFTATGTYTDNSTENITASVTWTSSATGVASISNAAGSQGLAATISPGTTTITATQGTVAAGTTLTVTAAVLTAIDVAPASPSIAAGLQHSFTATGVYSDSSLHDLTASVQWSSSAPAFATISNVAGSAGIATMLEPGLTTITATLGGISGMTPLTVTAATLVSIGVTPSTLTVAAGLAQQFKATGVYTDGSTHDLTAAVLWSSSSPAVATLSNAAGFNGRATGLSPGSATITAAMASLSGTATLTVTPATLVSIAVQPSTPSVALGTVEQLAAVGTYSDATTQVITASVTWSSSNNAVAQISNAAGSTGAATTLAQGSTTITARLGTVSGSTTLTVTPAVLASIAVTAVQLSIAAGTQQQFSAVGIYSDGTTQTVTTTAAWTSSAAAVASVSNATGSQGLATGLTQGSATITAALGAVSGSTTLTVTAAALVSIAVTPPAPSVAAGTVQQFIATGTYTDSSTQTLTAAVGWTSSVPTIATISNAAGSNGVAASLSPGSATITATLGGVSGTADLTVTAAVLVSLGITPANPVIADLVSQQFIATGIYTDNSTRDFTTAVTWTSSDAAVAEISNAPGSNGLAASLHAGSTTIGAASGSVSASTLLTVSAVELASIAVTPANSSVSDGTAQQFVATGTFSDGSTQDLTAAVTWSSSDQLVATVSNAPGFNGSATTLAQGSTTITAQLNGLSGSTAFTVIAASLVAIAVTPQAPTIALGTQQQFTATGTYSDGSTQDLTSTVTWSSSSAAASVSNASGSHGLATSLATGAPTITAKLGGISGATTLNISSPTLVSIAVTPLTAILANGSQRRFTATGTYSDGSTQNMTTTVAWSSSMPNVASISNAAGSIGLASTASVGSTSISAASGSITSAGAALTVTNASQYAYVANNGDNSISEYTVGSGGALAAMNVATVASGNAPASITVDPTYHYVYVANNTDNTVSQYAIGAGGALSALTPGTVPTGSNPQSVTVDPSGSYVYVANSGDTTVSQFTVGAQGALTAMSPATVTAGNSPQSVTVEPTGQYVYVANYEGIVSQFRIGTNGALTALEPASVTAGGGPVAVTVDPTARFVYVANSFDNTISEFKIGTGGVLSALSPATIGTDPEPDAITVDPAGRYVYVANADGTISQFSLGSNGALTALNPPSVQAGADPEDLIVDLSGHYVYVANEGDGTVSQFNIGTGGILPGSYATTSTGAGPYAMTTAY